MKHTVIISSVVALALSAPAFAEKKEIWHGWADMPGIPCSKTDSYKDDLGITWPTVKVAPQEHHTRIYLDVPNWPEVEAIVRNCALVGVGASGAMAFYLSPASAWPAFKVSFGACTASKGKTIAENLLSVTAGTICKW